MARAGTPSSHRPKPLSGRQKDATARARDRYLAAYRWRRSVEAELADVDLTLTQWLVLHALDDLVRETGDAVNQNAVAKHTELDRMTVSQVMTTLSRRDLVDRGPDASGRGYRISITKEGRKALRLAAPRVEAASERWLNEG
jgi:DNA-binding MarR family transcriptional regulator